MSHAKRILVVDDEPMIASTNAIILRRAGFDAVVASSGETAVQAALSFVPDVLLSDISMSGMNGIEAAVQILETLPDCKVLFLTGKLSAPKLVAEMRATHNIHCEVLMKPVPPPELLLHISQLIQPTESRLGI